MEKPVYPTFYQTAEFAELMQQSKSHVRHAAANYLRPGCSKCMAKMPEGWGAALWGEIYIIYPESEHKEIADLFNIEVAPPRSARNT